MDGTGQELKENGCEFLVGCLNLLTAVCVPFRRAVCWMDYRDLLCTLFFLSMPIKPD